MDINYINMDMLKFSEKLGKSVDFERPPENNDIVDFCGEKILKRGN